MQRKRNVGSVVRINLAAEQRENLSIAYPGAEIGYSCIDFERFKLVKIIKKV